MSIICFSSLKGGVGKTSLTVNVAHAFAHRGCSTLIIDLDPSSHATRLFRNSETQRLFPRHSPLAQAFLSDTARVDPEIKADPEFKRIPIMSGDGNFFIPVRESLELLPATGELRLFTSAPGSKLFVKRFPPLLEELKAHFDHILIDTPPDYNVLTRNSIACADIVIAPVDTSEMGIHSVEELLRSSSQIRKPIWGLVRTMVNSRAQRTSTMTSSRLNANLIFQNRDSQNRDSEHLDVTNTEEFLGLLCDLKSGAGLHSDRFIYLLDAVVYRTESQNQLSFVGRTAFDLKKSSSLARQYLAIAREIEDILMSVEEGEMQPRFSALLNNAKKDPRGSDSRTSEKSTNVQSTHSQV